jgi:very-short-patch-repair endonuclease
VAQDNDAKQAMQLVLSRLRGFKFKVQHPVLGYWRLLKKLHRVS